MKTDLEILQIAAKSIDNEAHAVSSLKDRLSNDFVKTVDHLLHMKGRLIISGIGKSAHIAAKIVSTLNSTGTPALFMHAADAIHGDLGMICPDDAVMCISKSGETPEIKVLVPLIKRLGNRLIALVGNTASYLAHQADWILDSTVDKEACPNNLAPTSSTCAQLALGDALAVTLLTCRGFTAEDFGRFHPGGALGKQLYLRVSDLCVRNEKPQVKPSDSIAEVILEMTAKRLGATAVLDQGRLVGMITDGDLRRMLHQARQAHDLQAKDIMNTHPRTIALQEMAVSALELMKQNQITQLIVLDESGDYSGIVHLHDILQEGII